MKETSYAISVIDRLTRTADVSKQRIRAARTSLAKGLVRTFIMALALLPTACLADVISPPIPPPSFETWKYMYKHEGVNEVACYCLLVLLSIASAAFLILLIVKVMPLKCQSKSITRMKQLSGRMIESGLVILLTFWAFYLFCCCFFRGFSTILSLFDSPQDERRQYDEFVEEYWQKERAERARHVRHCEKCGATLYRSSGGMHECRGAAKARQTLPIDDDRRLDL